MPALNADWEVGTQAWGCLGEVNKRSEPIRRDASVKYPPTDMESWIWTLPGKACRHVQRARGTNGRSMAVRIGWGQARLLGLCSVDALGMAPLLQQHLSGPAGVTRCASSISTRALGSGQQERPQGRPRDIQQRGDGLAVHPCSLAGAGARPTAHRIAGCNSLKRAWHVCSAALLRQGTRQASTQRAMACSRLGMEP
jgi:hypothetical protein